MSSTVQHCKNLLRVANSAPDEILRDRLVFGIRDDKMRERLQREPRLTLAKTDEICRVAESMVVQMKVIR